MKVVEYECFTISHRLSPRTGPSIAYSTEHAYVIVRLADEHGFVGWGETYRAPGVLDVVESVCRSILGREASLRALLREARWVGGGLAGGGFGSSAVAIALEDLRARQLGVSVADMYGGTMRDRVRLYAASGGYVEGRDPADTWPDELERALSGGFTALKLRVGRDPVAHEAPLLADLRDRSPSGFDLMADGNAAYTLPEAMEMGRVLGSLGFRWYEEPMEQRGGYVAYEHLTHNLPIAIAGGEGVLNRPDANRLLTRRVVDIFQPDPVICGGVGDTLFMAELAALHRVTAIPHCSNSALGIAASLQVIAALPDSTRSPSTPDPVLEYGIDENPNREDLLEEPMDIVAGWVAVPAEHGLGVTVNEEFLRSSALETIKESHR